MDSHQPDSSRKRKHRISSSLLGNPEEESWDCTVCTFKNSAEAFRCEMCQTRKGTSTRKPKLNPQIVEEQTLIARAIIKERQEESGEPHRRRYQRHSGNGASSSSSVKNSSLHRPTFPRNAVDRTCPQQFEVFANGFSVVITEYLPKNSSAATTPSGICKLAPSLPDSPAISNPSSVVGSSSAGNGTIKVENSYEATPYIDVSSSALAEFPAVVSKREGQEEGTKNQEGVDEYDIPPSPSVEAPSPLDSLSSSVASPAPRPRKRRKRRLQSSQGGNKIVRSLRSAASSISPGAASRSIHASRVARASLYCGSKNNTPSPRAYKRRKVVATATPAEDEAVAVPENPPPSSPQEKSPEAQVEGVEPEPNSTSQNTESCLIGEFQHAGLEASVLDVDCTGRFAFLAGAKEISVVDLQSPEKAYGHFTDSLDPSIIQCHPHDPSRFALVRRNRCEIYSWSANESRLAMTAHLQGYIRAINAVDWCPMQPNLFATASSEQFRSITVWDLRDPCRLVMNAEMYSPTSIIRWDPSKEYSFATGGELSVQFWDLRASTPNRHLSMQSSRVLAMAWSPGRSGEIGISTKDGSLRVWDVNDFDNALLVSNYKKIPMFHLRYTPKGSGIISVPQRTRWTASGLILWRSDTLSPMRLVPTMSGDDSYRTSRSSADGGNAEGSAAPSVSNISEDSCVLGFGWCRNEFPLTSSSSEAESEDFNNLRETIKLANLVSWSQDRYLRVHNLPGAFLHVDGVKLPTYRIPQRQLSPIGAKKDSNSKGSLKMSASGASDSNDWTSAQQAVQPQSKESEPPAFQFVTQEVSLLSSSIGQYTIENVDRDRTQCTVRLRLYYCRRNHYHHRTVCGFDLFNESSKTAADSRTRSDSLPLADLDALFQSTTDPIIMASAITSMKTGTRTLESLPSAGNVTLVAKFPLTYPAADCPPVFQFIASDPVINEVTLSKILRDVQNTAKKTVSTSRGCLEPCIRKVFKHLRATNLSFSSDEESKNDGDETVLASSDPYVSYLQDSLDGHGSGTSTTLDKSAASSTKPPSQDVFVPFPRTSGVNISPSGFMVTFGLHQPLVKIVEASAPVNDNQSAKPTEINRTPRSYYDYRQLVEGKEHLFGKATDSPLSASRQQQLQARFYHTPASNFDPSGVLKRSRSAEDICTDSSRTHSSANPSDVSLRGSDSPKEVLRSRHFSGKNPDTGARKSFLTVSGRKIVGAITAEQQRQQQHSRSSYVTRFANLPPSARKSSYDHTFSAGSPIATITDLSALIPISKHLAKNYSLDIADPRRMCSQNLLIAISTGRTDLIQFWSFATTLSAASLRQAPFPGVIPPYANQSIGQFFFKSWLSHFLHLGDVQSLTMLGFVMAALDAQSSPPALLLTAPFLPATVAALARQQQLQRIYGSWSPMESSQRSPFRRTGSNLQQAVAAARRAKSTVAPPNLALLDIPEMHPLMAADDHFPTAISLKRSTLKRKMPNFYQSQQMPNTRVERSSLEHPTPELVLNVPSASRTRSNSYTIHTSTSSESGSTTPEVSECSQRSPISTVSSSALEHKESTVTLAPDNQTTTSSSTRSRESSAGESAATALFFQYFKEQMLMDRNGSTREKVKSDSPYTSHVWLLSSKHMLQYTHFLKIYVDILTAWGLIIPRAKVSSQWYKVLTWMYSRSSIEYYQVSLCEPIDRQCQVLLSPREWRPQHMPIVLTHLLSFSTVHSEVIRPAGISGLSADKTTEIRAPLLRCAICNVAARGVIVACPQCLHGGHMEHMSAWRLRCGKVGGVDVVCPVSDCECTCAYLSIKSADSSKSEVQGTTLKSATPLAN